jgi:hypothetical protein
LDEERSRLRKRHHRVGSGLEFIVGKRFRCIRAGRLADEASLELHLAVLKLTLSAGEYRWDCVPIEGGTFRDSGAGVCH